MRTRGVITFVIDDGFSAIYDNVVPLLDSHRFPAVFAIPLDAAAITRTTHRPTTPWAQWLKLAGRGHEIAAHSVSHIDLTTLPPEQVDEELRVPQEKLGATTIVYPGGGHNEVVLAAAKKYYTAGRTIRRALETLPPVQPHELHTYDATRLNFSLAHVNALAVWACLTNRWLIETYHMIDDHEQDMMHTVPLRAFRSHLNFVARLPVAVKTIREVINSAT